MLILKMKKQSCLSFLIFTLLIPFNAYSLQNSDDETLELLTAVKDAAKKMSYSGTFVYQQGSQIRTSKITHGFDGTQEIDKLEILDGKPREYIRKNGKISCYLPESKIIQVEKSFSQEEFPALLNAKVGNLTDSYFIKKLNLSRVAGTECQVLSLQSKDEFRYHYRFCVEKKSGLLLGAQTLNSAKEVIEQIAFTQIHIGSIDASQLKPTYEHTANWKIENLTVKANVNSGWQLGFIPLGFKKTLETKRIIPISQDDSSQNSKNTKTHHVIQMMFSDGLSSISVFIEPNLGTRTEGSLKQGAMTIMGKKHDNMWITVVGEVPQETIKQVMESIQFKK